MKGERPTLTGIKKDFASVQTQHCINKEQTTVISMFQISKPNQGTECAQARRFNLEPPTGSRVNTIKAAGRGQWAAFGYWPAVHWRKFQKNSRETHHSLFVQRLWGRASIGR